MILNEVLQEIETAEGSISLNDLSQKLAIDRSTLEGMIQFWIRKGRLKDDDRPLACSGGGCPASCPGPQGCPFIVKMPKTYSISPEKDES